MSDLVVRDHSQPCEHGHFSQCGNLLKNDKLAWTCPGGREITLREYNVVQVNDPEQGWIEVGTPVYVVVEEA